MEGAELGVDVETEPTKRDFHRYGILSGVKKVTVHIFSYDLFDTESLILKTAFISGGTVLVIGNKNRNFISSYFVSGNTEFSVDPTDTMRFIDNKGNTYNAMGLVVKGPNKNLQLDSPKAYTAAWEAWQDFFENIVIYE